jgi:type IV secretion system protein VirB6
MIALPCQAPPGGGFVSGVLGFVDCQAQAIGAGGFSALAAPGSALSLALSILLTLFIALYGYRLLLGEQFGLRDGVLAVIKVGIVFTLALSWPAYRTLIYDVALRAPAEIASDIGRPAGLPGSGGGLVQRLDLADRAYVSLNLMGTGAGTAAPTATLQAGVGQRQSASTFDPLALGGARVFYLTSALGAFAGMRLIAGLMLALGPLFIAFLLFSSTRGLFEGWIRVLAGAALGALGTAVILGVQLALIEPRLAELVAWRGAGYAIPGAPVELLVISLTFALINLAVLIAAWRLTGAFAFPAIWRSTLSQVANTIGSRSEREPLLRTSPAGEAAERSRAAAVADSVATRQRRESASGADLGAPQRIVQPRADRSDAPPSRAQPLGQSGRRTRGRISASVRRRDGR